MTRERTWARGIGGKPVTDPDYDPERALAYVLKSKRKRQIVQLVARGLTMAEMAELLGVSERTIKSHITHARQVFGGIPRRDLPMAWFAATGENVYPTDEEIEQVLKGE